MVLHELSKSTPEPHLHTKRYLLGNSKILARYALPAEKPHIKDQERICKAIYRYNIKNR